MALKIFSSTHEKSKIWNLTLKTLWRLIKSMGIENVHTFPKSQQSYLLHTILPIHIIKLSSSDSKHFFGFNLLLKTPSQHI